MTQNDRPESVAKSKEEPTPVHELEKEELLEKLATNAKEGLTTAQVKELFIKFGPNELEKPPRISLFMLFIVQLNPVIMYLLMAAVVASAAIKATGDKKDEFLSYVDSIAILIIVLINATIAAVTENNANDALEALSNLQSPKCTIIRDGKEDSIESRDLVPGDIVKLGTGDVVPADVRCIEANDLKVNEMLLTGEPEDVSKKAAKMDPPKPGEAAKLTPANMAFSSSNVRAGTSIAVVVETGMNTRVGSIAALLNEGGASDDAGKFDSDTANADTDGDGIVDADEQAAHVAARAKKAKEQPCIPDTKAGQSPLQANLEKLAVDLGYMAIAVCVVVFIVGVALETKDPEDPETESWLFMTLVAVTLTVAAIPEGLPLCVTISLSEGCSMMVEKNVLMRKIAAVETLGSASIICTDKTGTLTEGKMTLQKMYAGMQDITVTGKGFDPNDGALFIGAEADGVSAKESPAVRATLASAVACSDTTLSQDHDEDECKKVITQLGGQYLDCMEKSDYVKRVIECGKKNGDKDSIDKAKAASEKLKWVPKGNSSEAPLIVGAQKIGITKDSLCSTKKKPNPEATFEMLDDKAVPFSSSRKMMVTFSENKTDQFGLAKGNFTAHVKGAPNYIMAKCTKYIDEAGNTQDLTEAIKATIMGKVDTLSGEALRVLAVARGELDKLPFEEGAEAEDRFESSIVNMVFCGLVASIDPERAGVKEAVMKSRVAGARVVMITGDYLPTAVAIACNIDILLLSEYQEGDPEMKQTQSDFFHKKAFALDCQDLRPDFIVNEDGTKTDRGDDKGEYLSNDEIDKLTKTINVFARAKPEDKLEIVKSLQRGKMVCAMTGDGVNDAPALKRADIGVAMGLEGTEVAKGASDMILTDDNFCNIVEAIEQGRTIYAGIQKFVSFIMSVHFAEVIQIFLCIVASIPVMRQPLQILFLILVTDLPPSIALGFEPGEPSAMRRKPRPKEQPVVMNWMWIGIVANGMILTCCIFGTYMIALWAYAGAFYSDDIISKTRTSCSIWPETGAWTPSLDYNCANAATGANYGGSQCDICIKESIRRARTCAFISLVWAEGFRAYVSRSFDQPVWVGTFDNPSMNKAVLMAQVTLAIALFCPGLGDEVLGLYPTEIHGFGWALALIGATACLVVCELFKCYSQRFVEVAEISDFSQAQSGTTEESKDVTVHTETTETEMETIPSPEKPIEEPAAAAAEEPQEGATTDATEPKASAE